MQRMGHTQVIYSLYICVPCRLHGCHLSTACCEDLSAALTTSQTLTYLDLAANRVEDSGVWLLCEGLKHPNCKLQRLRLGRCDLTDAGCGDLSAVLRANQSLTELELSYNKLGDAVVQLLCEILKHPNCKLQRLGLAGCYLTDAASADLATVLRTSQSLTELDLSGNNPGDAGVQLLCEALKHPNCKLQRLGLRSCHLTDTDCGDLAAVLSTNQSLIELDLSGNNPGDAGVRLLCEALKHPNCKLLYICRLKDADCEYLTAVLRTSQSLTELQLGANRLRDSGVQLPVHIVITLLCLSLSCSFLRGRLTGACCEDLAAVFRANESLTELDLSYNNLRDGGMQLLCKGLTHPNCKLQRLELQGCFLTHVCCGDLAAVFRTNHSLTELNLSENKLGDAGVEAPSQASEVLGNSEELRPHFQSCSAPSSSHCDTSHQIFKDLHIGC
uniref:Uncharacterized protein n=1 Tax=Chelydra serpentina TaxID=8475 RepID=A0A8C3SE76_CHESE